MTSTADDRLAGLSREERALLFERLRARKERERAARTGDRVEPREASGGPAPLSFSQQRLWFLDRLEPGDPGYLVPSAFRITGSLDPESLRRAFEAVVARHEALRTTFRVADTGPVQVVSEPFRVDLPVIDLTGSPEGELLRLYREESARPFDLETGPLLRVTLLKTAPETHVLLLVMHHIVSDGWSTGVLMRDVVAFYGAFTAGREAGLPELPVQYADFAIWQRQWLRGERLETQLAYWKRRLEGIPEALALPIDHPRPPVRTSAGARRFLEIRADLSERLRALAREEGGTLFVGLLAAFQALLLRYTGQEDLPVGTPVAGRDRSEIADLIGFFTNTLVLRGDLSGDPPFQELLARTRAMAVEAFAHQDLPFEMLVEELRPERDLSRTPLFQALLSLQNAPAPATDLGAMRVEGLHIDPGSAPFELMLSLQEGGAGLIGGLIGDIAYSTDLFEAATVERLARHLELLLAGAVDRPAARLSELPLLTEGERRQLLDWNATAEDLSQPAGWLHELFERRVDEAPDAVAVVGEEGSLSYRELDREANRLARRLRALGIGPESRVGVAMERSADLVAALLAIWKAGGAYVPVDPSYPPQRLAFLAEDSGIRVLLAQRRVAAALPAGPFRTLFVDDPGEELAAERSDRLAVAVDGGNAAYVIYTSGSTGQPKGVVNSHRAVRNRLLWGQRQYRLSPADRVLQKTPYSFDVSVWELFWPLITGARLVLARQGGQQDPAYLATRIAEQGVTLAHFVPSMLQVFLEQEDLACPSLRRVMCSGEALPVELQRRFFARFPGVELHNLYGPTEAAIEVTYHACDRASREPRVPIGKPVANTAIHLLDRWLRPVPAGVHGELCIGGVQVARGYQGRPDLTAAAFIPDPAGSEPGARLYRSGDLARRLPDGSIEFLGRLDFQVKIRGFRVELGEIEAALGALPGVREAAVLPRGEGSERRLAAYLVPRSGEEISAAELRDELRQAVPEPLIPSAFTFVETLPLTSSGKLDRRALAKMDAAAARATDRKAEAAAPRTPTEERLAAFWSEILGGTGPLGRLDNFFELGGHSLLATRVVSRVREAFGVDLPLRRVFEHPTLASLARHIDQVRADEVGASQALPTVALRRVPRDADLPLSFAQERLWFLDRLEPGGSSYNMPLALAVRGGLSPAALEAALGEVVRRHESLRTTFGESGGRAVQRIAPPAPVPLPRVDLSGLPEEPRRQELERWIEEDVRRPFDLTRGPLLRATLFQVGGEHALMVNMHHIVSDGWSLGVLVRELTAAYPAALRSERSPLPELPVQYADFAVWQREWLQGEELERQMAYWRERLAGAPTLDLPTDRPRPPVQSFRGATRSFAVEPGLARELAELGRRHGATLFMTLLAGFVALLRRLTGQDDLVLGSPIAGRNQLATEGLIGFFVNSLVLRNDAAGDPGFAPLLERVRNAALGAFAHQDLPFERLVDELRPERHLSHNPLFQVMFALQNAPLEPIDLPGVSLAPLAMEMATAKFDLGLTFAEADGGLAAALDYATDLFDGATAGRMAGHVLTVLAGAAANPGHRISELPLLTAAERHQLLGEWNDTPATAEPRDVVALFEAQAARTPEAVALVCGQDFEGFPALTYGELDRLSNRLARRLHAAGIGRGDVVGLCVERSPELVTGLLGILKAGAAYLPMDPGHPRSRLAYLIEDSGASALVIQARLAADLPPFEGPVVVADRLEEESEDRVEAASEPGDLAYLIYTSGTTGLPKAVMVERGHLASTLAATRESFGFAPGDRIPCVAPFSFDIFLFELLSPLLTGGVSLLFPLKPTLDVQKLTAALTSATFAHAVPALMRQVVDAARRDPSRYASLRGLFVGGDAVPEELLADMRETFPQAQVWVLYGPTEGTILATSHAVPAPGFGPARPLLGRPLARATIEVRDPAGRLLPVGVPGEVWIGGAGVARGYWRRDELTAEKFVASGGERYFRSGDLGRWLADGTLEFLGRIDNQVKVRGFRIELGEVESVLARHPEVKQAVVVAREEVGVGKRLVAYVVPQERPDAVAGEAAEHVEQWRTLYDETYGREAEARDATFDLEGWNSSYTGQPIPAEEMREWVERTVERVLSLRPRRVLEVGCGTGLLLFRIAPRVERYRGTDFSPAALETVRRGLELWPEEQRAKVELARATADDWTGVRPGEADLVVLNSVSQYFPDIGYLARVLEGAVSVVEAGGAVFVGDVRSLPLLEALHTSVELFRSPAPLPVSDLRRKVRRRVADEEELLVDPAFFFALARRLPAVRRVDIRLKRGQAHNELTRFRYDVVLHVDSEAGEGVRPRTLDWREQALSLPALAGLLEESAPEALRLSGIPNARQVTEAAALDLLASEGQDAETVEELRSLIAERAARETVVDPEALAELAERLGYVADLSPSGLGRFDAVLRRPEIVIAAEPVSADDLPLSAFANDPLRGRLARRRVPELRRFLQAELPEYMVPSAFVLLDRLPVTAHGKVDRAALPDPEETVAGSGPYAAPRTPAEEALAGLWTEVLGVDRVGVQDNFFELGGHSLLATQLVSRVRASFGVELPLQRVFETPTVAGLAEWIEEQGASGARTQAVRIPRVVRSRSIPLSFAQERLWFLDRLAPGSAAYNLPLALRIRGALVPGALDAALGEVARRHETLRTIFAEREGRTVQVIQPPAERRLARIDLTALPETVRETEAGRLADEEVALPFDLERGPLLRGALLALAPEEHRLLLSIHHIVSDGWSMGVLVQELTTLYPAALQGSLQAALPELPVQYADFAVWQRSWLSGETLERQIGYWRSHLAGAPVVIDLPSDRPRPPAQSFRGASLQFSIDPATTRQLALFAQQQGATLFMALLAAFAALLRRISGQEDLVLGTPIAGRNQMDTERLIGFFVNTLVLRQDLSGDPTFAEALGRARQVALGAYAHQDLPFEKLVEELRPERNLSHNPLFQVMFALQNAPAADIEVHGLAFQPVATDTVTVKFDLSLNLKEFREGLAAELEYALDLFDETTMHRLIRHFQTLLAGIGAEPGARLSQLPLLAEAERHQLFREWNDTRLDGAEDVVALFEAQAARTPEAAALEAGGEILTYGELDRRAGRLAGALQRAGAGPETVVGLLAHRGPEMAVGLLGILKAGAAFLPLDPAQPRERLAMLLEDSGAPLLVTTADLAAELPPGGPRVLLATSEAEEVSVPAAPASLAYLSYTSGTTGRPKAILAERGNLAATLHAARQTFGFEAGDRMLSIAPFAFDIFLLEVFGPLLAGGTVVLVPALPTLDIERLAESLEDATCLHAVPAVMRQLLDAVRARGPAAPRVRALFTGGDTVPAELLADLRETFPDARILSLYGPAEAAIICSFWEVPAVGPVRSLLGRPLPNARLDLRDRSGRLVPAGSPGEIWISGPIVTRGYLGKEALTAERFVPDVLGSGERSFRTGDLARRLPDGNLEFLGRADRQVKIRGVRIELSGIESVLAACPGVREAVVDARRAAAGEKVLVAWLVPEEIPPEESPASPELAAGLRRILRERLPDAMIPSAFVTVERLPLTPHGKVDRAALPAPETGGAGAAAYVAPRGPVEEVVAGIWGEVLGAERVGVHDNFFDLGGHSLLATQLVSRLRAAFQVDLPLRRLFEGATVAELAAALAEHEARPGQSEKIARVLLRIRAMKRGDAPQ